MLRLLTLLATAAFAIGSPINIADLASNKIEDAVTEPRNLAAPAAKWKLMTDQADWSPRAGGTLEYTTGFGFLLHGVGIYDPDAEAVNEVWMSADANAKKWKEVTMPKSPFQGLYSAISFMDKNGVHYRIQGTDNARTSYPDVWRSSDNGKSWTAQHDKRNNVQLEGTRYLGAGVSLMSSPETLLIWGGQESNTGILSDVWRSSDAGTKWTYVTDAAGDGNKVKPAFGPRSVNVGLSTMMTYVDASSGEKTDVDVVYQLMGYINGQGGGLYSNDIWVSTGSSNSIGKTWTRIVKNAPWLARGDAAAELNSNGVMVLTSGVSTAVVGEDNRVLNDVWASLDGGYSWGLCSEDAEFEDRRFQYSALDDKGHLFVMGGRIEEGGARMQDVWRSEMTFSDVATVARECNLLIPSCGAGLKCLPDMKGFQAGGWGVRCDACPYGPSADGSAGGGGSSSGGMSSIATVAIVILVIVAGGAAAAAYHFYRKSVLNSAASTEQTWWGKNGTSSLVGGDAQAPSDAMYNPLNIRDSNTTM